MFTTCLDAVLVNIIMYYTKVWTNKKNQTKYNEEWKQIPLASRWNDMSVAVQTEIHHDRAIP